MATQEQIQELLNATSDLVEKGEGIPYVKMPVDNLVETGRRLAKRVLELEESYGYMKACRDDLQEEVKKLKEACAYLIIVRNDTIDVLSKLQIEAQTLATQVKNLWGYVSIRRPGITLEELQDAPADEGCDSEA